MSTKKQTDPRVTALVLFVVVMIATGVFLRLWANDQRLEVPTFKAMAVAPGGDVYIVVGNELYIESASGESRRRIPLARWGVAQFHGDLVALADGSVVLAKGQLPHVSPREAKRILSRATSTIDPGETLMRCHPAEDRCRVLDGVRLGRAFGMDTGADEAFLYIAEPAKHRLLKLSLDGRQQAISREGWRFPNSAQVVGTERLGFTDTNNHRYVEVSTASETFGRILEEIDIAGWPEIVALLRFPSEALKDRNGTLWMLIARGDMADATLYRFPAGGSAQLVALPRDADPVALVETGGSILVADQRHFRIHRFSLAGELQEDFGSPGLKEALDNFRRDHDAYRSIFDYSLLAILLVALPALIFGHRMQKKSLQRENGAREEEVLASETMAISPTSMQGQYAQLRGEFIFWRKFSALGSDAERRFLMAFLLLSSSPFLFSYLLQLELAEGNNATPAFQLDWQLGLLLAMIAIGLMAAWLSGMFERLHVSSEAIRYTSMFPAPLSRFLMPGWSHKWSEVASVKLKSRGSGRNPRLWVYEVVLRNGKVRTLQPFMWRLAGEKETGVPFRSLARMTPELIRDAIRRTLLFRLIGAERGKASARAVKGQ